MSKFCTKCGQMLADDAAFCMSCGAKQEEVQPVAENTTEATTEEVENVETEMPQTEQPQEPVVEEKTTIQKAIEWAKTKPLYAGGVIAAAIVVLVGALYLFGVFGSAYEEAIDNYIAVTNGDFSLSALRKLYPEDVLERMDLRDIAEEGKEMMEYFPDDYKCTYKIKSEKEITGSYYSQLTYVLEDNYDIDVDDVGDAYKLVLAVTIKANGQSQTKDSKGAAVVEIDDQWYLVMIEEYDGEIEDVTFPEF